MQFQDRFVVAASKQETWQFISDVPRLLRLLPGCRSVQEQGDREYAVVLEQRLGPFQIQCQMALTVDQPEGGWVLVARGKGRDARIGSNVTVSMRLELQEEGQGTAVAVDSELQVTGALAQMGFGLMQHKAKELFAAFARAVQESGSAS